MKKRGKNSHMPNRILYTLIAVGILLIIGVGVYAATYTASGAGHPYTEISTCGDGQILKMSGGAWTCASSAGATPVYRLSGCCVHSSTFSNPQPILITMSSTCNIVSDYSTYCPRGSCVDMCPSSCPGHVCSNTLQGYV